MYNNIACHGAIFHDREPYLYPICVDFSFVSIHRICKMNIVCMYVYTCTCIQAEMYMSPYFHAIGLVTMIISMLHFTIESMCRFTYMY